MLMPSIFGETFMDDLLSDWSRNSSYRLTSNTHLMRTDIKENENTYEIGIELPGYSREDVKAELKNGYLIVTAVHESSKSSEEDVKEKKSDYLHKERYYGSCSRSYYIGKDIRQEDIQARFVDGVLFLDIPKHVEKPVEDRKYIQIA